MLKESGFLDKPDDFGLACRELVELGCPAPGEQRLAAGDSADPIDRLRRRRAFEQDVARARLECVVDALV